MLNTLLNLMAWLFVVAIATGSGLVIYRRLRLSSSWPAEVLVLSAGFGFLLIIYGTAALALIGWLRPAPVYSWSAIIALLAVVGFRQWRARRVDYVIAPEGDKQDGDKSELRWLWVPLGLMSLSFLVSAMAPPLDGDTLHSYLEVPRRYLDAGGILELPYEFFASLPLNIQMLSSFALLFRGDELAQMLTGFTMAIGGALVLVVIGRRYWSLPVGVLAALFYLSMHVVGTLVPTTKVNLGWAFFDLLSIYALCRWAFDDVRRDRWLVVAGLLGGAALGTAYQAGFTAVILAAFIVVRTVAENRGNGGYLLLSSRRLILYAVPVLLLASPWLIKNVFETGNPVHPFLSSFFTGQTYDPSKPDAGPLGLVSLVWNMSTQFTPHPYGKPIGPVFLALLPAAFLVGRVNRQTRWALVFIVAFFLLWYFFAAQRPRYLLTPVALWGLVAAYLLVLLGKRSRLLLNGFLILFSVYFLFELAFYTRLHMVNFHKLAYVIGVESRDDYLEHNLVLSRALPTLPMVSYMNDRLPPESRVAAMYTGNGYYVTVPFIDSRMLDGQLNNGSPADENELIRAWKQHDITHIFANDRYPSEDFHTPDLELVRSGEFRARYLEEIFNDEGQHLYRVSYPES